MRVLESAVLRLEPQVAAHADELFAVLSDPALYEFENEPPESLDWLRERFAKLETRRSPDGGEQWLNWVIRLPSTEAAGFVQATVGGDHRAALAYVLGSRYWGRGLASEAVRLMIAELAAHYGVRTLTAVFKRENRRSMKLLQRLGFVPAPAALFEACAVEPDELLMCREIEDS